MSKENVDTSKASKSAKSAASYDGPCRVEPIVYISISSIRWTLTFQCTKRCKCAEPSQDTLFVIFGHFTRTPAVCIYWKWIFWMLANFSVTNVCKLYQIQKKGRINGAFVISVNNRSVSRRWTRCKLHCIFIGFLDIWN